MFSCEFCKISKNTSGRLLLLFPQTSIIINPFVPNTTFLYPLKTSENCKVFRCFLRVEKRWTGNKWVKDVKNNGKSFQVMLVIIYVNKNNIYNILKQMLSRNEIYSIISQNSQEITCARIFFNKVAGLRAAI